MEISGVGVDIVENIRIDNQKLIKRFLSEKEYQIYQAFLKSERKLQYAAGRWAAKEAVIKSSYKYKKFSLKDIEIITDSDKKPIVFLKGIKAKNIYLSISHERKFTIAFCINY